MRKVPVAAPPRCDHRTLRASFLHSFGIGQIFTLPLFRNSWWKGLVSKELDELTSVNGVGPVGPDLRVGRSEWVSHGGHAPDLPKLQLQLRELEIDPLQCSEIVT
jgi:hypothetical protein